MLMDCPVLFVTALYLVSSVAYVYGLSNLVCYRSVSCVQCCLCLWIVQSCLWSFWGTRYRVVTNKIGQSIDTGNTGNKIQSGHKQDWSIHRHWQQSFCVLYPVLQMSMDCPVLFVIVLCLVPSLANVYGLSSLVCDRSVQDTERSQTRLDNP
jgi:hypothetical protein